MPKNDPFNLENLPTTSTVCVIAFGPIELRKSGYAIRCSSIVEMLSKRYRRVFVLEFPETLELETEKSINNVTYFRLGGNSGQVKPNSKTFSNRLTFDPRQALSFQIRSFVSLLKYRRIISSSDIVFIEGALIPAGNLISKLLRKKVVLDTHCVNKLLAKGFKGRNNLAYFARTALWDFLERMGTRLSNHVLVVSQEEKHFVCHEYHVKESNVHILPHQSVLQMQQYSKEVLSRLRKQLDLEAKIVVTFVGDLNAIQNNDAVEYIVGGLAPQVQKTRGDVVFLIIGNGRESFEERTKPANIIFTGFVDDLGMYLAMSDICIAPLRVGAGVKTKVLDYLKYGKQILVTSPGAQGLEDILTSRQICKLEEFESKLLQLTAEHKI
jgi:hypothetical protein